jgi:hypothetical protein
VRGKRERDRPGKVDEKKESQISLAKVDKSKTLRDKLRKMDERK